MPVAVTRQNLLMQPALNFKCGDNKTFNGIVIIVTNVNEDV